MLLPGVVQYNSPAWLMVWLDIKSQDGNNFPSELYRYCCTVFLFMVSVERSEVIWVLNSLYVCLFLSRSLYKFSLLQSTKNVKCAFVKVYFHLLCLGLVLIWQLIFFSSEKFSWIISLVIFSPPLICFSLSGTLIIWIVNLLEHTSHFLTVSSLSTLCSTLWENPLAHILALLHFYFIIIFNF